MVLSISIRRNDEGKYFSIKDPQSTLDYTFDWTDWISPLSDSVQSFAFYSDLEIVGDQTINGAAASVFIKGGVVGVESVITCTITTVAGRVDERSLYLIIKNL